MQQIGIGGLSGDVSGKHKTAVVAVLHHLKQLVGFFLREQLQNTQIMACLVILTSESFGQKMLSVGVFGTLAAIQIATSTCDK